MMKSVLSNRIRKVLALMELFGLLGMLLGCHDQKVDGPGMERMGAELVNVKAVSDIEGYWSEDSIGYVFEIFDNQIIVRSGIVQLETEIVNYNGKLRLSYDELLATPNNQIYGYISGFEHLADDTILLKVYLNSLERTDEHILRRVDYPYSYERMDSLMEEIAGTYVSEYGEEVSIQKLETKRDITGRTRHDCGYEMIIKNSQSEESREDFFLGKKSYKDEITIVNTTDFSEGFIVRKNTEDEYELVSLEIEMGEEAYITREEIYKRDH